MTEIKRKNSENNRQLSTMLVNWLITCGVFFYPTICALAFPPFYSCQKISGTPHALLDTFWQQFFGNFFISFPLTICMSALVTSYFLIYVLKLRDERTAKVLTIFVTGGVSYGVVCFAYFCSM